MYALEYSVKQKCFHISELEHIVKNNINSIMKNYSNDYVVIAFNENHNELVTISNKLKDIFEENNV